MFKKVKDVAGKNIPHLFDTMIGNDTQLTAVNVLAEDKPRKAVAVLPLAERIQDATSPPSSSPKKVAHLIRTIN